MLEFFKNLIDDSAKTIENLKDAVMGFFSFFTEFLSFLPSPFDKIFLTFSALLVAVIVFKLVRGS